jgi:mono/diheme cytochrome c family protein
MKRIMAVCVLLVLIFVAAAAALYGGVYDFGADAPHWSASERIIAFGRARAVAMRARSVKVPPLTDDMRADGASDYEAMCASCHLAPGLAENEMRPGLYPRPPTFDKFAGLTPAEQFWVIKHGIKMSGMPAWGRTHSDAEMWNMVAFLQKLPGMTPAAYKDMTRAAQGHHDMDHMDMDTH